MPKPPTFVIRADDPGAAQALRVLEPVLGNSPELVKAEADFAAWEREHRQTQDTVA